MSRKLMIWSVILLCIIYNINAQEIEERNITSRKAYTYISNSNELNIRLYNPKAKSFKLKGGDALSNISLNIKKDSTGFWDIKTSPVPIGFHYFWIEADNEKYLLPKHEKYIAYNSFVNGFEIDSGEDFFKNKNVSKGKIRKHNYFSKGLVKRNYYMYYPANFNSKKAYPLLVLYHGAGEDNTGWIHQGRIQYILDNLIAEKRIDPIMVLLAEGDIARNTNADIEASTLENIDSIEKNLTDSILLPLKQRCNITHFYIAGLSRGSFQALKISNDYPDIFSKVGLFSPVIYGGSKVDDFKLLNTSTFQSQSFFIGIGNKEKERYYHFKNSLQTELEKQNTNFKMYESQDTYHEWLTWRRCLYQFLIWLNEKQVDK